MRALQAFCREYESARRESGKEEIALRGTRDRIGLQCLLYMLRGLERRSILIARITITGALRRSWIRMETALSCGSRRRRSERHPLEFEAIHRRARGENSLEELCSDSFLSDVDLLGDAELSI